MAGEPFSVLLYMVFTISDSGAGAAAAAQLNGSVQSRVGIGIDSRGVGARPGNIIVPISNTTRSIISETF